MHSAFTLVAYMFSTCWGRLQEAEASVNVAPKIEMHSKNSTIFDNRNACWEASRGGKDGVYISNEECYFIRPEEKVFYMS